MTAPSPSRQPAGSAVSAVSTSDDRFARLIERISQRLEAGESVDLTGYIEQYPEYAATLRQLVPSMEALARWAAQPHNDLSTDDALAGRELGDFRILREIGHGGMGVVYECEQLSLGRHVALKVLPFAATLSRQQLDRFKNEARAAATLDHPHIVSVYSVGCERGVHYYAMQYVPGQNLAEVIAALRASRRGSQVGGLSTSAICQAAHDDTTPIAALTTAYTDEPREYFNTVARLGIQAAEALDCAHRHGIVHRDVKPANLLVDDEGQLWVTDFGLARMETDAGVTMTGDVIGTLRYMSPEQALGKRLVIDHRTDVYSLGATLYELLTLRPALEGDDRQQLLRQLELHSPQTLRSHDGAIPKDLETIVLKALEKRAEDRYDTAAELAEDLRRFLDRKPIVAKRASRTNLAWRWIARHRLVSALIAIILTGLVTSSIVGPLVAIRFARLADAEAEARQLAELNRRELQGLLSKTAVETSDLLATEPGVHRIHIGLLEDTVKYYKRLLEQAKDDPDVQFETALALRQLGRVHDKFGDSDRSAESYEEAIGLLSSLNREFPTELKYAYELAEVYRLSGNARFGETAQALELFRRSKTLFDHVASQSQSTNQYVKWSDVFRIYVRSFEGLLLTIRGEFNEADRVLTNAKSTAEQIIDRLPNDQDAALSLAYCKTVLSTLYLATGRPQDAEREIREGDTFAEPEFLGSDPSYQVNIRIGRAEGIYHFGQTLICLRRPLEAELQLLDAKSRLQEVLQGFPTFHWARNVLRAVRLELSTALLQTDRHDEAEAELRECIAEGEHSHSKDSWPAELTALATFQLGQLLCGAGRMDEGRQCFDELIALLKADEATYGGNGRLLRPRMLMNVMCPIEELRDLPTAVQEIRANLQRENGSHWQMLGVAEFRRGRWLEAREALYESVNRRNGGDAFDYFLLAIVHERLGERTPALRWYQKGIDSYDAPLSFYTSTDLGHLDELRAEAESSLLRDY